jgi:regulator of sigma E protease
MHARMFVPAVTLFAVGRVFGVGDGGLMDYFVMIPAGLFMLGSLVVIHEFGHFIVAKAFGIGVPIFSVGMGPRVAGVYWRGTDYRLSGLPIGGYVKLAGADPFGEEDPDAMVDPEENFMNKPVWQRLLVMLAGPGFNLALPFVLFTAVMMLGEPLPDGVIGYVRPESPADRLGVEVGDRLVAVDAEPVALWIDAYKALEKPRDATITLERDGARFEVRFTSEDMTNVVDLGTYGNLGLWSFSQSTRVGVDDPKSPAARAGLVSGDAITLVDGAEVKTWDELVAALAGPQHVVTYLHADGRSISTHNATLRADAAWQPRAGDEAVGPFGIVPIGLFAGQVSSDSAAEAAGVQSGDRLLAIDGNNLASWNDLVEGVAKSVDWTQPEVAPREVELTVVRDGEPVDLQFAPRMTTTADFGEIRTRPILGIAQYPDAVVEGPKVPKYYGPVEAFQRATEETLALSAGILTMLGQLVTGGRGIGQTFGGPVAIFRIAQEAAERGLYTYVRAIGMISISLGVVNLLPIPVLDGGQILFFSVEGLRGRPMSLALREKLQMAGVLALVGLFLVVMVFDVQKWLGGEGP